MKRPVVFLFTALIICFASLAGIIAGSSFAHAANTNSDYYKTPPFTDSIVTPDVLLLIDNSGSMGLRGPCLFDNIASLKTLPSVFDNAYDPAGFGPTGSGCGPTGVTGNPPPGQFNPPQFYETVKYGGGIFDPFTCYTYDTTNTRFVTGTTVKTALNTPCSLTEWDGNFLNWVTNRHLDALKIALIGGQCAVARALDGTCPPTGTPALITIKGQDTFTNNSCCNDDVSNPVATGTCATPPCNTLNGRVPTAVQTLGASPAALVFAVRGVPGGATAGSFCVWDNAQGNDFYTFRPASCTIPLGTYAGTFTDQQFVIRVGLPAGSDQPKGVIQTLGDKVRFGIEIFNIGGGTSGGGVVAVPIGSLQAVNWSTGQVTTYPTRVAALVNTVDVVFPGTWTPLAESFYEGVRYFMQVSPIWNQFAECGAGLSSTCSYSYEYPYAFSPAASFSGTAVPSSITPGTTGTTSNGGLGTTELGVLSTGETCPSGYLTNGCGRDPFFYGSNTASSPPWATPSTQVTCCKAFIVILTDGQPTQDNAGVPVALQDYAHQAHWTHCSSGSDWSLCNPQWNTTSPAPPWNWPQGLLPWQGSGPTGPAHKTDWGIDLPNGSHFLDDVALWAHTVDLRQTSVPLGFNLSNPCAPSSATTIAGHDIPGVQSITTYVVYETYGMAAGRELLAQTARQGGFVDSNGNCLPDLQSEWDAVDNLTGAQVPDGIPDSYFESGSASDLSNKISAALASILQKASSGAAVSVLSTSTNAAGAVYQAYFFPNFFNTTLGSAGNGVVWPGFLQGLFLDKFGNLREDYSTSGCGAGGGGLPDGKLVLNQDCIVKFRLNATNDVIFDRWTDVNGVGKADDAGGGCPNAAYPFPPPCPIQPGVPLAKIQPMWEAGRRLALATPGTTCAANTGGPSCRRILTWVDLDNDGKIQTTLPLPQQGGTAAAELVEFSTSNATTLCPYLGNVKTSDGATPTPHNPSAINCNNTASPADQTSAQSAATDLINFIRGNAVTGLRDRRITTTDDSGSPVVNATWRLGDILDSSPTAVGAPRERYDIIYGDSTYAGYFQKYKDRRSVIYVGANDGMLHAFNGGFVVAGDDLSTPAVEQVRFLPQPVQPGTSTVCASLPCDGSVTPGYTTRANSASVPIGAELWAFIPQDLLPQLQWLSNPNYQHAYYVDLTPKVTDARIFTPDADHPGGWGTIVIGGFRYGGSCTTCPSGSAGPRTVTSDFSFPADNNTTDVNLLGVNPSDSRVFFSSYFVLDITNPEKDPVLLWTVRDLNMGLTTSAPVVIRTNPSTDPNTSSTNEKWFVVFGSGPTNLDSSSGQTATFYVVDLKQGPTYNAVNQTAGMVGLTICSSTSPCIAVDTTSPTHTVWTFSTGQSGSVLGDLVGLDSKLSFRTDVVYAGSAICTGGTPSPCNGANPVWRGAMWRLTTNGGDPNPANWGNAGAPSILISNFGYSTPPASTCTGGVAGTNCNVGPALSAPVISTDDNHNIWLFFGTGRFFTNNDKTNTDIQHYFGVKDSFMTLGSPGQGTQRNNLFNVSKVSVCTSCPTSSSIDLGSGSFTSSQATLMNTLQSMDGWFTVLSNAINPPPPPFGERNLSSGTLLGGTIFFTTFVPVNNICVIQGSGFLYGLYYGTGAPYAQAPALGTTTSGPNTVAQKSVSLGYGLPAQMAIQIGGQGTGTAGTSGTGQGCASRVTGFLQTSTGMVQQVCTQPAGSAWSRMLSWRDL